MRQYEGEHFHTVESLHDAFTIFLLELRTQTTQLLAMNLSNDCYIPWKQLVDDAGALFQDEFILKVISKNLYKGNLI